MGKMKLGDVHGVLLLDKPQGLSSHRALQKARHLLGAGKCGHTGSLDPMATGLLPLCFGEATKFSSAALDADKRYIATIKLGETTDTYDAEGEIQLRREVPVLTLPELEQYLDHLRGSIQQVPPIYSALKKDGQPLYKLARAGKEVDIAARPVTVYQLDCLSFEGDVITLDLRVSKGTYIRSIAYDLGELIGCGAHLTGLRRTEHAGFSIEKAYTLEQIEALGASALAPMDLLIDYMSKAVVRPQGYERFSHGNEVVEFSCECAEGLVRAYTDDNQLLGLAEIRQNKLFPRRLLTQLPI